MKTSNAPARNAKEPANSLESMDVPPGLPVAKGVSGGSPRYVPDDGFWQDLRARVDAHFRAMGSSGRDAPGMVLKSAAVVCVWIGLYAALVFAPVPAWLAVSLAAALGLASAAIGFNIAHDGGHKAYSRHRWVNRIAAATLDLVGGSSVQWRWKHGVLHHQYVNLAGFDTDIDVGVLGRLSPFQKHRFFHRWQHLYMWPLYGFLALKWHLVDDFQDVARGWLGRSSAPRLKGRDLAGLLLGKAVFFAVVFAVPSLFHPVWVVVSFYVLANLVQGLALSLVFQLAHAVEGSAFPPVPVDRRMDASWAVHQVRTTSDFCRGNRVLTWLLGGLNFQIEHHLFPQICHVHYPVLSRIVETTCREHGLEYREHPSFLAGVGAHYRWLKRMSAP
jgi:linoleoyl-CoA desaturase